MPFDTTERTIKRLKSDFSSDNLAEWYMQPSIFENLYPTSTNPVAGPNQILNSFFQQDWNKLDSMNSHSLSSPSSDYLFPNSPTLNHSHDNTLLSDTNSIMEDYISPQPHHFWHDDSASEASPCLHRSSLSSIHSPLTQSLEPCHPTTSVLSDPVFQDLFSKIRLSYTDVGINLEAKLSSASDLRSLIDTFSQMCSSQVPTKPIENQTTSDKRPVYRNKSNQTKPVNFFESACRLGQNTNPHSCLASSERQIADACVDTFFSCWVRHFPILQRDEFMTWYKEQSNPLDTLIVNAICTYVFRHVVIHHPQPFLNSFLKDQDKLQEQEEYFFNRARECLAQSFDTPDRYTIISLLFMSVLGDQSRRHHYIGMAASALQQLDIYPRMMTEDADDYEKEMDTRLWWFAWAIDFSLYTAGAPKNTPQPRHPGPIDYPQVFEQDIDETEINVITFTHCLKLWKIQSDIITCLYEQEKCEMTVEMLAEYDGRLLSFYEQLPKYFVFDSGFEYGCEDLFVACLRVNIEYNATRIILHKLFIPEMNDPRPSQASLESLNICLVTSLKQLSAIKTCNMADIGRCAFDRDELWRAAEVISIATDAYHNCVSPQDQAQILQGIRPGDFKSALTKSFQILQATREFKCAAKNWCQVADWMQVEIRRHQLIYPTRSQPTQDEPNDPQPDYFLAQLKPNAVLNTLKPDLAHKKQQSRSMKKSQAFQNQFSISEGFSFSEDRKSSFSHAPPFVQFNAYCPDQQNQSSKNPARFRYFNPRKMNKFLFIDEHPM